MNPFVNTQFPIGTRVHSLTYGDGTIVHNPYLIAGHLSVKFDKRHKYLNEGNCWYYFPDGSDENGDALTIIDAH